MPRDASSPQDFQVLLDLVWSMRDGELDSDQITQLDELVCNSPAARQTYSDLISMLAGLHWACPENPQASVSDITEVRSSGLFPTLQQETDTLGMQHSTNSFLQSLFNGIHLNSRFLGIAASVLIVCYFGALAALVMWDRGAQPGRQMTFESFATLTWGDDCNWEKVPESAKDVARTGRKLQVHSGLAELLFADGTKVVLEGPAEFEVRSASSGYLYRGRLVAAVLPQKMGFKVDTATATVVDLGTEFGIAASEVGETELSVFVGSVAVRPGSETNSKRPESLVVQSGEAKRIKTDGTVQAADSSLDNWALLRNSLTTLVAYWAFDEKTDPVQDYSGNNPGQTQRARRVTGLIGPGALRSDGSPGQLMQVTPPKNNWAFTQAVSVEAVFVSSWSGKSNDYDFIFRRYDGDSLTCSFVFKNNDQGKIAGPVLALQLDTDHGRQELVLPLDGQNDHPTLAEITDGRAHHVAATFDGNSGKMVIYVDGVPRANRTIASPVLLSDGMHAALAGQSDSVIDDPFSGTLDEVAIYRVALSPEEIARHWSNVRHGRNYLMSH